MNQPQKLARLILALAIAGGSGVFVLGHVEVVRSQWSVIGVLPGAWKALILDAMALLAWVVAAAAILKLGFRGDVTLFALPFLLWCIARPVQFAIITNPLSSNRLPSLATADPLSVRRTILEDRTEKLVNRLRIAGLTPVAGSDLPASEVQRAQAFVRAEARRDALATPRVPLRWYLSALPLVVAPLLIVIAYWAVERGVLDALRYRSRVVVFTGSILAALARFVSSQGGWAAGFTPIELVILPTTLAISAMLAENAVDLRQGARDALTGARGALAAMLVVSLPFLPMGWLGASRASEFGLLAVVLSSVAIAAIAAALRLRFLAAVAALAIALVALAFIASERPRERLVNAYSPYAPLATLSEAEQLSAGRRNMQLRSSDSAILDGSMSGSPEAQLFTPLIPRAGDDLIFSALAVRYGFCGVVVLAALYLLMLYRIALLALSAQEAFTRCLTAAAGGLLAAPFLMAYWGSVRAAPLTGVAAAFISMGGAKYLAAAAAQGMLLHISHDTHTSRESRAEVNR